MAATATASSAAPRFAPPDPTLPKPWKGLVDGKTGYLYFWNPVTNVTQYERPTSVESVQQSSSLSLSSQIQVRQSAEGHNGYNPNKENDRHGRGINDVLKLEPVSQNNQNAGGGPVHSHNSPNGTYGSVIGGSARGHGLVAGGSNLSGDAYRGLHEITVTGDEVPLPFSSFEATGFPSEILREVRYLLLVGANVVLCGALCGVPCNFGFPLWWTNFGKGFLNDPRSELGLLLLMIQSATRSERKKRPTPVPACFSKHWLPAYGGDASCGMNCSCMKNHPQVLRATHLFTGVLDFSFYCF